MFILMLMAGVLAGLLAGLLGLGGGILFTPVLFYVFSQHGMDEIVLWSVGTSLFCTFIAAISSVIRQRQQHNFFPVEGIKLGVLGAVGVYGGRLVLTSPYYNEQEFVIFFCLILCYVAYRFLMRGKNHTNSTTNSRSDEDPGRDTEMTLGKASVTGLTGGFVASLAGIGGGGVMVPIMNLGYGISIKRTVSISSTAIVLISLSGWAQMSLLATAGAGITPYSVGFVDFGTAFPLVIGAIAGGFGGAWLSHYFKRRTLHLLFSFLALAIAAKLIIETFL